MIWTRRLMRTAFIFLVTMTMLANESESNIRTVWIPLDSGEPKSWADTLKSDGARLYAGTRDGLYVSLDNGYTWRSTDLTDDIGTIAISTDAVYATTYGTGRGVYRSDDRGETWKPINNAMPTITIVRAKDGSEYEALPHSPNTPHPFRQDHRCGIQLRHVHIQRPRRDMAQRRRRMDTARKRRPARIPAPLHSPPHPVDDRV